VGDNGSPVFFVYPELVVSLSNHCRGATPSTCPERVEGSSNGSQLSAVNYWQSPGPGTGFVSPRCFLVLRGAHLRLMFLGVDLVVRGKKRKDEKNKNSGANLGFEAQLWQAAD